MKHSIKHKSSHCLQIGSLRLRWPISLRSWRPIEWSAGGWAPDWPTGWLGGWLCHLEDRAGGRILGHKDLVLDAVDKEVVGLSAVGVVSLSQRHQLHCLALLGKVGGAHHKHMANRTLSRQSKTKMLLCESFTFLYDDFLILTIKVTLYHASFVFTAFCILTWNRHNILCQFHIFTWQLKKKLNSHIFSWKFPVCLCDAFRGETITLFCKAFTFLVWNDHNINHLHFHSELACYLIKVSHNFTWSLSE